MTDIKYRTLLFVFEGLVKVLADNYDQWEHLPCAKTIIRYIRRPVGRK